MYFLSTVFRKFRPFGKKIKTFMEALPNKQIEYNWQRINWKYYQINRKHPEKFSKHEQKYLKMDKYLKTCPRYAPITHI